MIDCCVLRHWKIFFMWQNESFFIQEKCCPLMICLWIMDFQWGCCCILVAKEWTTKFVVCVMFFPAICQGHQVPWLFACSSSFIRNCSQVISCLNSSALSIHHSHKIPTFINFTISCPQLNPRHTPQQQSISLLRIASSLVSSHLGLVECFRVVTWNVL